MNATVTSTTPTEQEIRAMTMRQLTAYVKANPDDEYAWELLQDYRVDAQYERETYGDPEDTPSLDAPWWESP